ncbi:uncharacterized protein BKA78DRAFT_345675, partial [Phyllosticta capitalensis]|uniref:uncharacterized protein n=1 Tax=Phyllosticta capitalensis TaxID=121624 RepID=UPI00312DA9EC
LQPRISHLPRTQRHHGRHRRRPGHARLGRRHVRVGQLSGRRGNDAARLDGRDSSRCSRTKRRSRASRAVDHAGRRPTTSAAVSLQSRRAAILARNPNLRRRAQHQLQLQPRDLRGLPQAALRTRRAGDHARARQLLDPAEHHRRRRPAAERHQRDSHLEGRCPVPVVGRRVCRRWRRGQAVCRRVRPAGVPDAALA